MTTRTAIGTLVGLGLGVVVVFASFSQMLLVALFAGIGFIVGRVFDGDLDLNRYVSDRERR